MILEKARREDEPLRLSPQLKESMIASSKRNITDLEEAKSKIADAISAAIKEVEDKIKAQKKQNAKAKKEGNENIRYDVHVLRRFFNLDASKKEIKEQAEEYVVDNLPRNARGLIMPDLYETEKKVIGGFTTIDRKRTGAKIEDIIDSIIEGEKKDIARYESAEEAETEEIVEEIQEISREKPREKDINEFINEEVGDSPRQFKFDYAELLNILKSSIMVEGIMESLTSGKVVSTEEIQEMQVLSEELEESVLLATNILSRMGSRDVDSLRNLRKALISVSRAMKKDNREGVDDLEAQISAITERLEEFPTPSGPEITPKTLKKLKSIKKMLELLDKTKDEELMVIEVLGRGNPSKNTFTELKNIAKNPQRVFYLGVPKSEDFLAPLGVMQKMTKATRYTRPKEAGKEMERYKELGELGQEIHDLLNKPVDEKIAAVNEAVEIEEDDKELLAELERSKKENSLLHLLRQVYRSMTGQILDIGADKELQRKFREERQRRLAAIEEERRSE